jgi:hypothetical protein
VLVGSGVFVGNGVADFVADGGPVGLTVCWEKRRIPDVAIAICKSVRRSKYHQAISYQLV